MYLVVRSSLPSDRILPDVRRAVQNVDRTLAIHDVRLMTDIVQDSLQLERVSSLVMTFFGLGALLMATLGIYGVVSYGVRQRTVELGTRMALGAVGRDLMRMVVGGGLRMAAIGMAVGAVALIGSVVLLARALDIRDVTWVPFALSIGVVAFISVAASYVPAWRASLLSPMVAIRDESSSAWQSVRRRFRRAMEDVKGAVTIGSSAQTPPTLLTEFVAAARAADSFDEALRSALSTLCERLGVESAVLLEKVDDAYRGRIAIGAFASGEWTVPVDGFLAGRLAAYPMPLPFERDELGALAEWAAANRPERLDEIRALAQRDVRVAVPLRTRTEVMGILLLGPSRNDVQFGAMERQVLRNCADQFALMMENARLTDRVVGQEALRRDLALAAEVQKRLLPSGPPSANIAEFAAISLPARSIGGDYYDFIQVGDQRIGHRAGRRVRQGRGRGADHVRRAGVAADHRLRWRHLAAASRRAHERLPVSHDAGQQVRDVFLRTGGRRSPPASLRQRRAQSAVSRARPRQHASGARPRRWRSSRSEERSSACCLA